MPPHKLVFSESSEGKRLKASSSRVFLFDNSIKIYKIEVAISSLWK